METKNIMDTLTPPPPFPASQKNQAVKFTIPKVSVALKQTTISIKGINRTKDNV